MIKTGTAIRRCGKEAAGESAFNKAKTVGACMRRARSGVSMSRIVIRLRHWAASLISPCLRNIFTFYEL